MRIYRLTKYDSVVKSVISSVAGFKVLRWCGWDSYSSEPSNLKLLRYYDDEKMWLVWNRLLVC